MKKLYAILILLLFQGLIWGAEIIPLTELISPDSITVDKGQVYITDRANILIYSIKDFKLKKKFGRAGEGPKEFKVHPGAVKKLDVTVTPGYLLVNSQGRISYFSKSGEYIKERNIGFRSTLKPVGKNFVGYSQDTGADKTLYLTINLYGPDIKFVKEIYRKEYYVQPTKKFNRISLGMGNKGRAVYDVHGDRIFVQGEKDDIHVFDKEGRKQLVINLDYKKMQMSESHKKTIMADLHTLFTGDFMRNLIKKSGYFPEYFPARAFVVADNKIYIPTYKKKAGKNEFVVYDTAGKLLAKTFLPFKDQTLLMPYPWTVSSSKVYQLFDNEESEEWELHVSEIN
ncbi:MAG: hypothetical protein KAW12_01930 [Candidatus Aminicenantes bacterium]|nr:hypothetical protein [Candidatus Aminicenantes bacterium]